MANDKIVTKTQKIIVNPANSTVSVINAGPIGPRGFTGPADLSHILTIDGQIMTRASGNLAPITRANLAADSAFTAGLTAHVAAADPHPVYLTGPEGTTAINAAISAHVALTDPHPVYVSAGGDIMTGTLTAPQVTLTGGEVLHISNAGGYFAFFNGATREGYVQGNAGGLTLNSETGVMSISGNGGINFGGGRLDLGGGAIASAGAIACSGVINGYTMSGAVIGNRIVLADASGYISGNYINMTANVVAGYPPYMAGQNGDNFLRWYNKSGPFTATRVEGTASATSYADCGVSSTPGSGNAGISFHCGGVAPMIFSQNGQGNNVWLRDAVMTPNSTTIRCAGYLTDSSKRWKKNVNNWPLQNVGAAVESATDVISKLRSITYQNDTRDIEVPDSRRTKAWLKLNRIRAEKGLNNYELPTHDCEVHECSGTREKPCIRVYENQKQRHGFIAEELFEIVPSAIGLGPDGLPDGIEYQQLTAISIAAIQELIERVKVLEGVT